jgi:hypothetical protein
MNCSPPSTGLEAAILAALRRSRGMQRAPELAAAEHDRRAALALSLAERLARMDELYRFARALMPATIRHHEISQAKRFLL